MQETLHENTWTDMVPRRGGEPDVEQGDPKVSPDVVPAQVLR